MPSKKTSSKRPSKKTSSKREHFLSKDVLYGTLEPLNYTPKYVHAIPFESIYVSNADTLPRKHVVSKQVTSHDCPVTSSTDAVKPSQPVALREPVTSTNCVSPAPPVICSEPAKPRCHIKPIPPAEPVILTQPVAAIEPSLTERVSPVIPVTFANPFTLADVQKQQKESIALTSRPLNQDLSIKSVSQGWYVTV